MRKKYLMGIDHSHMKLHVLKHVSQHIEQFCLYLVYLYDEAVILRNHVDIIPIRDINLLRKLIELIQSNEIILLIIFTKSDYIYQKYYYYI